MRDEGRANKRKKKNKRKMKETEKMGGKKRGTWKIGRKRKKG
jgi:hypothetical protein